MKLIKNIFFLFINLISTPTKDFKETSPHKEAGIYKEFNDIHLKTKKIERVLESSIVDLETDYKECREQIRAALIKDNEEDARFWLQKQSLIKITLHKYNNIFFTIKHDLAEIDDDIKLLNYAYSQLNKNHKNTYQQIAS